MVWITKYQSEKWSSCSMNQNPGWLTAAPPDLLLFIGLVSPPLSVLHSDITSQEMPSKIVPFPLHLSSCPPPLCFINITYHCLMLYFYLFTYLLCFLLLEDKNFMWICFHYYSSRNQHPEFNSMNNIQDTTYTTVIFFSSYIRETVGFGDNSKDKEERPKFAHC